MEATSLSRLTKMAPESRSLTAPEGLASAAKVICMVPNDILADLCMNVLLFIQYKKSNVDTSRLHQSLQSSHISCTEKEVQLAANSLCYHYRCAIASEMSVEALTANLHSFMLYTEEKIQVIIEAWKLEGRFLPQNGVKEHLSIGELLNIDWKLSMAISSSSCRVLNSPVVTMVIRVLNPNGEVFERAFEMSLDQFHQFSNQLEQTKAVLETL